MPDVLIISCEHGGNRVPARYRSLFAGADRLLASHRGYDPGALLVARRMASALRTPLYASTTTRLLVDLNRSLHHPAVFSARTAALSDRERRRIVRDYYRPHRDAIEAALSQQARKGNRVIHIGVHTFTPVFRGARRNADVGLLYDPARPAERSLCAEWIDMLEEVAPKWRCRRNYPYRGSADGLTTSLRNSFSANKYVGIELEINQRHARSGKLPRMAGVITRALRSVLTATTQ